MCRRRQQPKKLERFPSNFHKSSPLVLKINNTITTITTTTISNSCSSNFSFNKKLQFWSFLIQLCCCDEQMEHKCDSCAWHLASKRNDVETPPQLLVLSLTRFSHLFNEKLRHRVYFDTTLAFKQQHYRLVSTIQHHDDSINNGHYVVMCVDPMMNQPNL